MNELVTESCLKVAPIFYCEKCHYNTSKKSSFAKHLQTNKHNVTICDNKVAKVAENENFKCDTCEKKYLSRNGLWVHKKKCPKEVECFKNQVNNEDIIMMLIKQNSDLIKEQTDIKHLILELCKNGIHNTTNNINSNNKTFNLQVFLNETCKDAMNITDFIDSIKLQLSDLEDVGRVGYVEGISNIIIKNLNNLDETKRPLHCTDKKREIIYVKDEGQWEKEDDNKSKLKKLISKVSSKNSRLLTEYREKYPDCRKCDSKIADKFNKMIIEAMGGPGENNKEKEEKIIRNISSKVTINKFNN
jgi:hypothetical protein